MVRAKYRQILLWMFVFAALAAKVLAEPEGPPPAIVATAPAVERMVAENAPIVGIVYYDKVSQLSTEVSGKLRAVHFRQGDLVEKGALLVELNTDFIDRDIEAAQTRIQQIAIQIEQTERDLTRYQALYDQQATSEKTYDDLQFQRRSLIEQKNALEKELEIQRLKKKKSRISAPFEGIVLEKFTEIGDWVGPGDRICRIGSLQDVCVKAPVAEELAGFSKPGDMMEVTVHALGKTFSGKFEGIIPIADPQTKNAWLKIRLPKTSSLAENMSATVLVSVSEKKLFTLVPRDALVSFQGGQFVYAVIEGKAALIPVQVSAYVENYAAVVPGPIQAGMAVVVDGNQRLRPDQPVAVKEINSSAKP